MFLALVPLLLKKRFERLIILRSGFVLDLVHGTWRIRLILDVCIEYCKGCLSFHIDIKLDGG